MRNSVAPSGRRKPLFAVGTPYVAPPKLRARASPRNATTIASQMVGSFGMAGTLLSFDAIEADLDTIKRTAEDIMEQDPPLLPVAWERINEIWFNHVKGLNPNAYFGIFVQNSDRKRARASGANSGTRRSSLTYGSVHTTVAPAQANATSVSTITKARTYGKLP